MNGKQLADQYALLEKLGTGSFGVVYKGMHKETNQIVAIKQIDLEDSDDDISEIQMEIAHLAQCDSDWVTRYYGSFVKGYKLWIGKCYLWLRCLWCTVFADIAFIQSWSTLQEVHVLICSKLDLSQSLISQSSAENF